MLTPYANPSKRESSPMPRADGDWVDRRKHIRFPLRVVAFFSWAQPRTGTFSAEGVTRDVSANGAFIFSSTCPPADALVHVEILLPRFSGAANFLVTANMRPQRFERAASTTEKCGFAVAGQVFVSRHVLRTWRKMSHLGSLNTTDLHELFEEGM